MQRLPANKFTDLYDSSCVFVHETSMENLAVPRSNDNVKKTKNM